MNDILTIMQKNDVLSSQETQLLRKTSQDLGENQIRLLRSFNIASSEQIQDYLQKYFRVPLLSSQTLAQLNETHKAFVPVDLALHYSCFGVKEKKDSLYIALEDPSDKNILSQLSFFLERPVVGLSATEEQLKQGLQKIYGLAENELKLQPSLEKTRLIEKSMGIQKKTRTSMAPNPTPAKLPPSKPLHTHPQEAPQDALLQQFSWILSQAMVRLAFVQTQNVALKLLNQLLTPLQVQIGFLDKETFELKGESTSIVHSFSSSAQIEHPIFQNLTPLMKKISQMK